MIFDLRIYTMFPGKFQEWLKHYEKVGYPIQVKHLGKPVLYSTTEVGTLNQAVHIWKYESHADREKKRGGMMKDPKWQAYLKQSAKIGAHLTQEDRLLKSTPFSPL